ncbi:SCO family protein [Bacillus aquiflavi]|uniref:SCO family protein n=1 Tax=Bacillus aquiflavi TaxID=2672567 RepID=A0A6B3VX33_9BACI|nr:SCO family protein [Bacillus aquiflavi]MBA4535700.1 SCO family protein [Bacillus aquiflavi]NEY80076.1 SCO family protein [Bacillus aquiflavi]
MKKLYITFVILLVIGIAAGIYYFTGYRQSKMEFPQEITMETHTGEEYSFKDMPPKVRLLEFMYTNCPDICPNTTFQMKQLRDKLVDDGVFGDKVEFITITIDPYNDTQKVLQDYAAAFEVDKHDGWYLLRGTNDETKKIADKFNFLYRDPGTGYLIHSSSTYLLNEKNRVIEVFGMGEGSFDKDKVYKQIQKELK